jgi:hypothetical protein
MYTACAHIPALGAHGGFNARSNGVSPFWFAYTNAN